jgi:hyperosmotically inducible periplasmic protein
MSPGLIIAVQGPLVRRRDREVRPAERPFGESENEGKRNRGQGDETMKTLMIAGVALSLALLGGCSRSERTEVGREAQGLGAKVERAAENAALTAKVKAALATRKGLKGADIHVETNGSAVTLKGDVNTREQAKEAVQVAKGTAGVTTVNNQLMLRVPVKS